MSSSDDRLFAQIALDQGYVQRHLIHQALAYQKQLSTPQSLGQILLTKNVLSRAQYEAIVNRATYHKTYGRFPDQHTAVNNAFASGGYTAVTNSGFQQGAQQRVPKKADVIPDNAKVSNQLFKNQEPCSTSQHQPRGAQSPKKSDGEGFREASKNGEKDGRIIGRIIGGCLVTKKIGQGGMGTIYLAQHSKLDKKIVVKILPPNAAKKKKSLERFRREAKAAARLEHPNIVQVLDVDKTEDGLNYILMQFVDGRNLREIIETKGAQSWQESTRIVLDAASALEVAHKNHVIHRDIKAENIMLTKSGQVKIADFGLAKDLDSTMKLTAENAFIGTPLYMAPEIGRSQIDGRVDVFSLGVTYYYLLTGVQPLRGFKTSEILQTIAHEKIAPPEKHGVQLPGSVLRILSKMLAKNRDKRYRNMEDLVADLRNLQNGNKISAGPSLLWEQSQLNTMKQNLPMIVLVVLILIVLLSLSIVVMSS